MIGETTNILSTFNNKDFQILIEFLKNIHKTPFASQFKQDFMKPYTRKSLVINEKKNLISFDTSGEKQDFVLDLLFKLSNWQPNLKFRFYSHNHNDWDGSHCIDLVFNYQKHFDEELAETLSH